MTVIIFDSNGISMVLVIQHLILTEEVLHYTADKPLDSTSVVPIATF